MTAPDCTNPGYTTRTCSRCDYCETEEIAALGHQYDSEVTIPDCTNPGYTIHTCVRCGDCYRTHETLPTGHRYDLGTIISEATCHQEGVRLYQCINCDASYEETIEKVPHFYEEQITPPTCENDGASCYVCGVCGATESGAVYPALGHEYVGQRIPAAETEGGYTIYTCLNCGDSYVENETPPLGIVISGTITSFLTEDAVTVELLLDGQVIGSQTLSGENRDYSFRVTERGNYTLRVTKKNHVSMEYNLSTENEHVSLDGKLCPVGDVTGDGGVNVKDFQRLLRHINKTNLLSEDELAWADVTGDGVVNVKDFQRLLRHINKTNPLF